MSAATVAAAATAARGEVPGLTKVGSYVLVRRIGEDLGLDRAHVHTLASGGHTPQLPLANPPEWTARNVDEIGRVIQSMMVTAHEQTRSPLDSATTATA